MVHSQSQPLAGSGTASTAVVSYSSSDQLHHSVSVTACNTLVTASVNNERLFNNPTYFLLSSVNAATEWFKQCVDSFTNATATTSYTIVTKF